jgi:hypothetical protein
LSVATLREVDGDACDRMGAPGHLAS